MCNCILRLNFNFYGKKSLGSENVFRPRKSKPKAKLTNQLSTRLWHFSFFKFRRPLDLDARMHRELFRTGLRMKIHKKLMKLYQDKSVTVLPGSTCMYILYYYIYIYILVYIYYTCIYITCKL